MMRGAFGEGRPAWRRFLGVTALAAVAVACEGTGPAVDGESLPAVGERSPAFGGEAAVEGESGRSAGGGWGREGQQVSVARPGVLSLGRFEGEIDPYGGPSTVRFLPLAGKEGGSAALPGVGRSPRTGTQLALEQDVEVLGYTVEDCGENYWLSKFTEEGPEWRFWLDEGAPRTAFYQRLLQGPPDSDGEDALRFCTEFALRNMSSNTYGDLWLMFDGIALERGYAFVDSIPRRLEGMGPDATDLEYAPVSDRGMFNYGPLAPSQEVSRQWYFYRAPGSALQRFRVSGDVVEILHEQCGTGQDDNGDGIVDSGCGTVSAGAGCYLDADCLSLACENAVLDPDDVSAWVLGTCALSEDGQACGATSDCEAGLECVEGTCQPESLPPFDGDWALLTAASTNVMRGLSPGGVMAVGDDGAGRVLVGTREGLSILENGQWTTIDQTFYPQLRSVTRITSSGPSAVWIVSSPHVGFFDGSDWTFSHVATFHPDAISVRDVITDAQGRTWVAHSQGVTRLNGGDTDHWSPADLGLPAGGTIMALAADSTGTHIWAGTGAHGVLHWGGSGWVRYDTGNSPLQQNNVGSRLAIDTADRVWIAAGTTGASTSFVSAAADASDWVFEAAVQMRSLHARPTGGLMGNGSNFPSRWTGSAWVTYPGVLQQQRDIGHVSSDDVYWHGYGNNGSVALSRLDVEASDWEHLFPATQGIVDHEVREVIEDGDGRIWLGGRDGIVLMDGAVGEAFTPRNSGFTDDQLGANRGVRAMAQTTDGALWFGTPAGGLFRYLDGEWSRYRASDGLGGNGALSLSADDEGGLWIAVSSPGLPLVRLAYRDAGGSFSTFGPDDTPIDSAALNHVVWHPSGDVWLGGPNALQRYQPDTETWTTWTTEDLPMTAPVAVRGLALASDDAVWVVVANGFLRWDGDGFTHYDTDTTELPTTSAFGMLLAPSADGMVWVSLESSPVEPPEIGLLAPDGRYRSLSAVSPSLARRSGSFLSNLFEDTQGRLWVVGRHGVDLYAPDNHPTCAVPGAPANGAVQLSGAPRFGALARTTCNPGYAPTAWPVRTCNDDGNWSGDEPACVADTTAAIGDFCLGDAACASGLCDPSSGTCRLAEGQVCAQTGECASGLTCDEGQCSDLMGYFVRTSTTFMGNMGGLVGANDLCLNALTNGTWLGKDDAMDRNLLDADHVRAFLCINEGCQDTEPNTRYAFAAVGDVNIGGHIMRTDSAGRGPGDSVAWNTAERFGISGLHWTGRSDFSPSRWGLEPHPLSCFNWGRSASFNTGVSGPVGSTATTNANRWIQVSSFNYCSDSRPLICVVHPRPQPPPMDTPCITLWGEVVPHGGSVVAYQSSAACEGGCQSQVRVCTHGVLSGSYDAQDCVDNHPTCTNRGYLVISQDSFPGNLGGLAGADAICHDQVTSLDWRDKALAGDLTPGRVRAFLCDATSCRQAVPDTVYQFAGAGSSGTGGDLFLSDGDGRGPGDTLSWLMATRFLGAVRFWTGRAPASADRWSDTPGSMHCNGWTGGGSGHEGTLRGGGFLNPERWGSGNSGAGCTGSSRLVCFVDPE